LYFINEKRVLDVKMEVNENHEKIIGIIKESGPSLPMQIARKLSMDSLFISAFLSELVNRKRVKVSHLKVGGSPLYFLEGQEKQLEPYHKYLHPKEGDAFLMLKKARILKDSEQEPSIRVALRSIRDFSLGFKRDEEIFWRYFLVDEEEVRGILEVKEVKNVNGRKKPEIKINEEEQEIEVEEEDDLEVGENVKIKIKKKESDIEDIEKELEIEKNEFEKKVGISKKDVKIKDEKNEFENPLVMNEKKPVKKKKEKSEFVLKVIDFIKNKGFEIISEGDYKAKEYNGVIKINSDLGFIKFLTQAKDKKTITETDLRKLLSNAQATPLPALMIYTGEIGKKAVEFTEKYSSVLKILRV
jgi:hypothetical protein